MTKIVICKNEKGQLDGLDPASKRAYSKWRKVVAGLEVGETLGFYFAIPRSPVHHRKFMRKMRVLTERSETFERVEDLRDFLILGAGFVDMAPGLDGQPFAKAKRIDFEGMKEPEFAELHTAVDTFLWTEVAQRILWPALAKAERYQMVAAFVRDMARRPEEAEA